MALQSTSLLSRSSSSSRNTVVPSNESFYAKIDSNKSLYTNKTLYNKKDKNLSNNVTHSTNLLDPKASIRNPFPNQNQELPICTISSSDFTIDKDYLRKDFDSPYNGDKKILVYEL